MRPKTYKQPAKPSNKINPFISEELGRIATAYLRLAESEQLPKFNEVVTDLKKALVCAAMELCQGNHRQAAAHLRMQRPTLSLMYSQLNPHHKRIVGSGAVVGVNAIREIPCGFLDELRALLDKYGY